MARTVVGLFDRFDQAQNVVQSLINSGYSHDQISLVARDHDGRFANQNRTTDAATTESAAAEGAGAGAVGGTAVGGALGLLVGLGALAIPGVGPVVAAGSLVAVLGSTAVGAGIGAAAGGLIGALVGAGIPEEDAHFYTEGVRRGGTLVMVQADEHNADTAYRIMQQYDAVDIDERRDQYRASGWDRFDPDAEPYDLSRDATYRDQDSFGGNWEDSSKIGTAGGTAAGAATGAAIGSVGGPVGTAIGGVAGAVTGAGVGAAGDAAGEAAEDSRAVGVGDYDTHENDFRNHYQTYGSTTGYSYDQYAPVYRYGYELGNSDTYRNSDWSTVEPDARRRWEERNPGTWEQFKDSIQYAWDRARGYR